MNSNRVFPAEGSLTVTDHPDIPWGNLLNTTPRDYANHKKWWDKMMTKAHSRCEVHSVDISTKSIIRTKVFENTLIAATEILWDWANHCNRACRERICQDYFYWLREGDPGIKLLLGGAEALMNFTNVGVVVDVLESESSDDSSSEHPSAASDDEDKSPPRTPGPQPPTTASAADRYTTPPQNPNVPGSHRPFASYDGHISPTQTHGVPGSQVPVSAWGPEIPVNSASMEGYMSPSQTTTVSSSQRAAAAPDSQVPVAEWSSETPVDIGSIEGYASSSRATVASISQRPTTASNDRCMSSLRAGAVPGSHHADAPSRYRSPAIATNHESVSSSTHSTTSFPQRPVSTLSERPIFASSHENQSPAAQTPATAASQRPSVTTKQVRPSSATRPSTRPILPRPTFASSHAHLSSPKHPYTSTRISRPVFSEARLSAPFDPCTAPSPVRMSSPHADFISHQRRSSSAEIASPTTALRPVFRSARHTMALNTSNPAYSQHFINFLQSDIAHVVHFYHHITGEFHCSHVFDGPYDLIEQVIGWCVVRDQARVEEAFARVERLVSRGETNIHSIIRNIKALFLPGAPSMYVERTDTGMGPMVPGLEKPLYPGELRYDNIPVDPALLATHPQ